MFHRSFFFTSATSVTDRASSGAPEPAEPIAPSAAREGGQGEGHGGERDQRETVALGRERERGGRRKAA